uniref:HP domain-containing protein n=1 Tax=Phaeomonas parva TaxID=124430 RepID=A0A7S1UA25_9STRA|mmetsp:Transcript_38635/g.120996  ORF Transcript_38635/g.120996 Transcript_38635/m.120996 type:complete len:559 (+) Transcript_38635:156-1832(+)
MAGDSTMAAADLQTFDMSAIEEMDPSCAEGFNVIYDREVPFELRVQQNQDGPSQVGTLEAIKVKILLQGDDARPSAVRIELSSEADLFYHYGLALMKVGNMKLAGEVFRKCLDINPKHQMATDGLSRVEGFNAGFVVAAAVHRRRSQMGSAAGPETGMYTPGSPAGSSTLSKGTARSDASEILRERAHRRSNSLSSRSLGVDEVGSDGSYPVSPRAEIAFLKEQLGRRQDLIEDLQRQVAFLTEELTEARKAGVGASGSASGRSRRKPRKSLQGSYVYRGPAAFPEEHKKPRKRLSATSTTSADNLGRASLESRDGSILIDGPEEGAGKPKMSQVRPVLSASSAWGASSGETVDTEGTTGEVKQRQSIVSVVSLDEEPAVVQEIVGSENRGGRLSGTTAFKNSAYGADEKPPATSSAGTAQGASETDNNAGANSSRKSIRQTKSSSPNRQRNNNGQPRRTQLRRSLSRRHLQEYTPSVSIMDLTALDNTSSEDALIDMRFQLSVLQAPGPFPPGINIQERERYLTDKDFEAAFGVNRVEFTALSKWRRLAMKKELGLW